MASRIEQLIDDIYEFVEGCKMQPLSSTKVIVPKDELYDLIDELKLRTPDEIKRYQKIINNRDAIIADAEEKAAGIIKAAEEKAATLVDENEIMQQAYYQADQVIEETNAHIEAMLESAQAEAEEIRVGALTYANDLLTHVENVFANAYETINNRTSELVTSLRDNLNVVVTNREELYHQLTPEAYSDEEMGLTEENAEEEELDPEAYQFDPDTFTEGVLD